MGLKTQYLIANKQTKKWIFSCLKMGNKFKNGRTRPASPYKLFHNVGLGRHHPINYFITVYSWSSTLSQGDKDNTFG